MVGLIKMHKELALTARECLRRDAVVWWRYANDAMAEWNERKEYFLYNPVEQCDRELSKPPISCKYI